MQGFPGISEVISVCLQWRRPRFDPWVGKISLEKEMATHSSILAWRIPWTEEPGGLQSMGSQRVGHDWATSLHFNRSRKMTYAIVWLISWHFRIFYTKQKFYLKEQLIDKISFLYFNIWQVSLPLSEKQLKVLVETMQFELYREN